MNPRILIVGSMVWVVILVGIFIYGRVGIAPQTTYNASQEDSLHPPSSSSVGELNDFQEAKDEPYIGGHLSGLSKPKQIVEYFIDSINSDDLDASVSLVEPNYFLKHVDLEKDFYELVRLWEPGEVIKYKIEISNINVIPLPCSITISMSDGRTKKYELELVELTNFEANPPIKDWYIQNIKDATLQRP